MRYHHWVCNWLALGGLHPDCLPLAEEEMPALKSFTCDRAGVYTSPCWHPRYSFISYRHSFLGGGLQYWQKLLKGRSHSRFYFQDWTMDVKAPKQHQFCSLGPYGVVFQLGLSHPLRSYPSIWLGTELLPFYSWGEFREYLSLEKQDDQLTYLILNNVLSYIT
jgi:hypothetical protein